MARKREGEAVQVQSNSRPSLAWVLCGGQGANPEPIPWGHYIKRRDEERKPLTGDAAKPENWTMSAVSEPGN